MATCTNSRDKRRKRLAEVPPIQRDGRKDPVAPTNEENRGEAPHNISGSGTRGTVCITPYTNAGARGTLRGRGRNPVTVYSDQSHPLCDTYKAPGKYTKPRCLKARARAKLEPANRSGPFRAGCPLLLQLLGSRHGFVVIVDDNNDGNDGNGDGDDALAFQLCNLTNSAYLYSMWWRRLCYSYVRCTYVFH